MRGQRAAREFSPHAFVTQPTAQVAVALVVEPVAHRLGDGQADLVYVVNLLGGRRGQAFERAESAREQRRHALADVAYAEAVNELRQVARLARLDLSKKIRGGLLRHSFERSHLFEFQFVEVGHVAHHPFLHELFGQRVAQALDPHRAARGEVEQTPLQLRRAVRGHAARDDLAFGARDDAAAHGTLPWEAESLLRARAARRDDAQDLRDDLAALLYVHPVADLHAQALDLVLVVQRRARDHRARELHRREHGDRGERARATDLHDDVLDLRRGLPRGVLVGDGPARRFRGRAELVLQRRRVDLHDHAVNLVLKIIALGLHSVAELDNLFNRGAARAVRVDAEARRREPFERLPVGREGLALAAQNIVGEEV